MMKEVREKVEYEEKVREEILTKERKRTSLWMLFADIVCSSKSSVQVSNSCTAYHWYIYQNRL